MEFINSLKPKNYAMKWLRKDINNTLATIGGIAVAIANGWITIDWANFDSKKEWPKLLLSAVIAIAGYKSRFNKPINNQN